MVPANGILVSLVHKTEDSTLAGGFDVVHVCIDFAFLLKNCGVRISDGDTQFIQQLVYPCEDICQNLGNQGKF